jgi:hypothetical protein
MQDLQCQEGQSPSKRNKRSVWTVNTQPFVGAHFAVFPEALIEPCILAGTSERGQCPSCGAPWVRVVERQAATFGSPKYKAHGTSIRNDVERAGNFDGASAVTTGWQPSCACNAGDPIPQTVLDPFCGSGTTGVVACRHNRHFIGVELNPTYAQLAERRITGDAALFNSVEVSA